MKNNIPFVFFGSPEFAVKILDVLKSHDYFPVCIVTQEDKPKGRKLIITPPPVKIWAQEHSIPFIQPKTLRSSEIVEELAKWNAEVFIVASYGKIIPQAVLDIPKKGTLNVHPSLLPKLRGASPIPGAILQEEKTGVSIMLLDADMDHGPILAQEVANIANWPPYADELENILANIGGNLLVRTLPEWVQGNITAVEQEHDKATFVKKIEKEDALIDLSAPAEENLRKIKAYAEKPNAYTFLNINGKQTRIIIKKAHIDNGLLVLDRIIPEGKREMSFEEFKRGHIKN
jgi:methionyl-tRNA formyltransferase